MTNEITDIYIELFKRKDFRFITDHSGKSFEKQRYAFECLTDDVLSDILLGGGAGGAKAQPLDSTVYTQHGKKRMGDMNVGDVVIHPNGCNSTVIAIHPQGKKDVYEFTFIDGAKTRCCGDHLWNAWESRKESKQEITNCNSKIYTTDWLYANQHRKFIIPLTEPVKFNSSKINSLLSPYVLGFLIGAGGLTIGITYTTIDDEIHDYLRKYLPDGYNISCIESSKNSYSIVYNHRDKKGFSINPMYDEIRKLGLNCKSEHKFIPEKYLHAALEDRFELVRGLMDSDGTIDTRGHCSYSTSSEQLALDFQYIVRSLGYKATINKHNTTHLPTYSVYIQGNDCSLLFKLKRKKERAFQFNGGFSEIGRRIEKIEKVGKEECQCITVSSPDGLYLTDDFIVTHNSFTGWMWITLMAISYPETHYFISREVLKDLVLFGAQTFSEVSKALYLERDKDYKFNGALNYYTFSNNSKIYLLECRKKPSDVEFAGLGSSLYTCGFMEEAGQNHEDAYLTLKTRVGRWKNDELGIKSKILLTCNPSKGFLYNKFYLPKKNGNIDKKLEFIPSLAKDNPYGQTQYVEHLENLPEGSQKQRLLYGQWEYDDDPTALLSYDQISRIWTNSQAHSDLADYFIVVDAARRGKDKAVITVWQGFTIKEIVTLDRSKTTDIEQLIWRFRNKYNVFADHCIVDDDGVGGGITDHTGIIGFRNGSSARNRAFYNLKCECGYKLAEKQIIDNIYVEAEVGEEERKTIESELGALKTYKEDLDGKLRILPKAKMKELVGHSPDYLDCFIMRMYFELSYYEMF